VIELADLPGDPARHKALIETEIAQALKRA
jgi:hypothetical protein